MFDVTTNCSMLDWTVLSTCGCLEGWVGLRGTFDVVAVCVDTIYPRMSLVIFDFVGVRLMIIRCSQFRTFSIELRKKNDESFCRKW